jgi:hypothetical protein
MQGDAMHQLGCRPSEVDRLREVKIKRSEKFSRACAMVSSRVVRNLFTQQEQAP